MTPLDGLASMLRSRLTYHAEMLIKPGEDPQFHCGCLHAIINALNMLRSVQRGEKYDVEGG